MEEALLQFEIEVMKLGNFEDVVNSTSVVVKVGTSSDPNVIHIDKDGCAKGFVLENDVPVDIVHHGLECRWRIGEPKIHDCGFEKSISGFKRCLLFISLADAYVIVPPSDIKFCIYVCVAEVVDEIRDQGKRILVLNCDGVDLSIVLYWLHFAVFLVNEEE